MDLNASPAMAAQRQRLQGLFGGAVQLRKDEAAAYLLTIAVGHAHFKDTAAPTQREVISFAGDSGIDAAVRTALVRAWNAHQAAVWRIDESIVGTVLAAPMSPSAATYDGRTEDFSALIHATGQQQGLYAPSSGLSSTIPVIGGMPDAARAMRAYWAERPQTSAAERSFAVQQGQMVGLFEAPRPGDFVFTKTVPSPLSAGDVQRSGGVRTWQIIAADLQRVHGGRFHDVMREIVAVARNNRTASDGLIFEAAGAMLCDAKQSVQGLIMYLDDIMEGVESGELASFDDVFARGGVYTPAGKGGRKATATRRDGASADELAALGKPQ
jgi:hypothetical protein